MVWLISLTEHGCLCSSAIAVMDSFTAFSLSICLGLVRKVRGVLLRRRLLVREGECFLERFGVFVLL